MAFTLPDFNLPVDIYTGPWTTRVLRVSVMGNLAYSRRVNLGPEQQSGEQYASAAFMSLLLPALTDVRSYLTTGQADSVEVPAGSGRWYSVDSVDDIGKGFANEHRCAMLSQSSQFLNAVQYPGLTWPIPIP